MGMGMTRASRMDGVASISLCLLLLLTGCRAGRAVPELRTETSVAPERVAGLSLRWFGTSTLTISDPDTTIMIDGFFSRPRMTRLGLASIGLPLIEPDTEQLQHASQLLAGQDVDALFVAHAHHDHALDTAVIAREKHATVYGSASVRNVVCGQDPAGGLRVGTIADGHVVKQGAFTVTVLASSHDTNFFGPGGEITDPLRVPARLRAFRSGPSFAFLVEHPAGSVLVVPSAVMDGHGPVLQGRRADVVLLGIGMLGRKPDHTIRQYWDDVVCPTQAARVHLIHWDDFMTPLSEPLRPFRLDRVDNTVRVLSHVAGLDDVALSYLPLSAPVEVTPSRRTLTRHCPAEREPPTVAAVAARPARTPPEVRRCAQTGSTAP